MLRTKLMNAAGVSALLAMAIAQTTRADTSPTAVGSITVSGSTAFASFFESPGSTNDFINVNNNAAFGFNSAGGSGSLDAPFVEQLAPSVVINGTAVNYTVSANLNGAQQSAQWSVQYRGTGSVNGISELVHYRLDGTVPTASSDFVNPSSLNGSVYSGAQGGPAGYPSGTPINSIDVAVSDVAIPWAIQGTAGAPRWNAKPTTSGYGANAVLPANASSSITNQLTTLSTSNGTLNTNVAAPDSKTIFSTGIAFAPISFVANHGTGLQNLTQDQLGFMYVTGRAQDGTNYIMGTRDSGSGTRNGAMNSIGVDPSFGTGDNTGDANAPSAANAVSSVGAGFNPDNLDATGTMGNVVKNARLGVGYVSTSTGKSSQATGTYETLGVMFTGGTGFVRPTADTIVNNGNDGQFGTGWRVGGVETAATVGDPLVATTSQYTAATPGHAGNPAMANAQAALYVRNIYESINAFESSTANSSTFMPAQSLINVGVPLGASTLVQDPNDPTHWIANSAFVQNAHDAELGAAGGGLNTGAYGSGTAAFGVVPTRTSLAIGSYSDGQTASYRFFDSTGAVQALAAGTALNFQMAMVGDFNGDSARNGVDIPELMSAINDTTLWAKNHNSGQAGAALGTAVVPELQGDFNADGNFDKKDVRYFADGLALRNANGVNNSTSSAFNDIGHLAGTLDRRQGFRDVDNAWFSLTGSLNYFGTVIATGKPYAAGDSRGDIAGATAAIGAAPTGSDGIINAKDIDYAWKQVHAAMGGGIDGSFATILTRATVDSTVNVRADLSADINGDLKLDASDIDELVQNVLGTNYGDADLSGIVDLADFDAWFSHVGTPGVGWADADFDGSGVVDLADFDLWFNHVGFVGSSLAPGGTNAVPEPASLTMLALGGVLLLKRRRGLGS